MNVSTKNLLRNIVEKFGTDLTKSPSLCDAYLSDLMPAYPEERSLLVNAVSEGVPTQLLVNNSARHQSLLADRIANIYLIPEAEARQVVDAWSFALQKEYERAHQNNDRHVARHYLGGVLTGLIVLGVSSAIAVYQVPGGNEQLLSDRSLQGSTQNVLAKLSSQKAKPEVDEGSQMQGILSLKSDQGSEAGAFPGSMENDAASSAALVGESNVSPGNDESALDDQYFAESLLDTKKDFLYESDSTIEIQNFDQSLMSADSFAEAQRQVEGIFKTRHATPQLFKDEELAVHKKQLSEKVLAGKKEILEAKQQLQAKMNEVRENKRQAVVDSKLAEQRQRAEVSSMKKAEATWLRNKAQQVVLEEKEAEKARIQKEIIEAKKLADAKSARKEAERIQQELAKRDLERKQAEAVALKKAKEANREKQLALAAQQKKELELKLKRNQAAMALKAQQAQQVILVRKQQAKTLARKKAEQALARQQADKAIQKRAAAELARKKAHEAKLRQARLKAKRAENLRQQQAKANQAKQRQAINNSQKNVAKVQGIARQLMGSSITFGQLSVLLQKKRADLGVLKNLLKLTKEDFYLQQQREVNGKIDSLRKKQDALSARYVQHLQQLCNLPVASMQMGVHSLAPAYAGKQGVKAVAFRMLKQHTARCSQVKRIQNHALARELSLAYGRVLTNP